MKIDYMAVGVTVAAAVATVYLLNHFMGNVLISRAAADLTAK
jgi:hypothetical protein